MSEETAMTVTTCKYDSGSATGCQPLCDRRAEFVVTYRNGSYPAFKVPVCGRHVHALEGAVFPGHESTERVS